MSPTSWTTAALLLRVGGFLARVRTGDGHVYLMSPISRQLWGTEAFQEPGSAMTNYCPHCFQSRGPAAIRARANGAAWPHLDGERAENGNYIESDDVSQRHGICGDPEQTAAEGDNRYGLDNSNYPVLETVAEGGILEVKIVVSTYHWGHVEMFLCDTADLPGGPETTVIQSCFNKYPLDRAEDDEFNGPVDPNNRGRFILDPPCRATETDQEMLPGAFPGDVATARFQLPQGVTCDRCVVQMVYYTGNSCKHQGYAEFNPPSWPSSCAPAKEDWINEVVGQCGEGDRYPEEFWNCADIEITSDGGPGGATAPTPEPVGEGEEVAPSPAPTIVEEEEMVVPSPAPTIVEEDDDDYEMTIIVADDDDYEMTTQYSSEEGDDFKEPTPSPVDELEPATPMNEPSTPITTTFAPSVAPPVSTHSDCDDPVAAFGRCGGGDYKGSTCCRPGYDCEELAECYSECRPKEDGCSEGWGQCGGMNWDGPNCCWDGATCLERNEWYSQCVPDDHEN
ncbi:unnamed protein product [Pylaiella littoralis]